MSYAQLQTDVANWMHRSDLTSVIPSFISMAEEDIFVTHQSPLRVREMETEVLLTPTSLAVDLPTDFLEARYIKLDNSTRTIIYYIPPAKWSSNSAGYFTIVDGQIKLPTGVSGDIYLVYYAKPDPLATTSTNDVFEKYGTAYLNAALKYAHIYTKNMEFAQLAAQNLDAILVAASKNKFAQVGNLQVVAG